MKEKDMSNTPEFLKYLTPTAAQELIKKSIVWYQKIELSPGIFTPGSREIKVLIESTILNSINEIEKDQAVLDIGTTNLATALYCESLGFRQIDAIDIFPKETHGIDDIKYFFNSNINYMQASVYDSGPKQKYGLILFLGVLYHLRHPLLALDSIYSMLKADGIFFLETVLNNEKKLYLEFFPNNELADDHSNWFAPSESCLYQLLISSGFEILNSQILGNRIVVKCKKSLDIPGYIKNSYERNLYESYKFIPHVDVKNECT